ncbi:MAG: putative O-succinylbenzoic acid synthase [Myxococcaceae bacterium]|nr:putative O-succinylbenzoic acid synthase [Myxococcaceae bacterium]
MKISVTPLSWKLAEPIATALGAISVREGLGVGVADDEGAGKGEATPLPQFGTETLEDASAALLTWRGPGSLDSVEAIAAATAVLHRTPAARHGLELALLDRLARIRHVPLARLLCETPRREVRCAALIDGPNAASLAQAAERAVAAGFEVLKIKVAARTLTVDAQRLLAVRRAVGEKISLRIDANGGWTESAARTALRGMESLGLELCEQPVAAGDVGGLGRIRGQVPCQIAADEALLSPEGVQAFFSPDRRPAADVVVLKPMALGGLLPALALARRAHQAGVGAYVTTLLDGPLARAAAAHLAAAIPQGDWANGLATVELFEGCVPDAFTPVRGRIRIPTAEGLGV